MSAEIGGVERGAARRAGRRGSGLPVVDADGMGRAFPLIPQVTMQLAGIAPNPAVMTDERGNVVVFQTISGHWIERLERAAAVEFGGAASSTEYSLTVGAGARRPRSAARCRWRSGSARRSPAPAATRSPR